MVLNKRQIKTTFYIAIIASIIACLSDIILLYVPGQNYFKGDYLFYQMLDTSNMIYGHYLGIIFMPLQLLALPWLDKRLYIDSYKQKIFISILLIYTVIMGCVYHGSCALLGTGIKESLSNTNIINVYNNLFIPVALLFIIGLTIVSFYLAIIILKGKSVFKKVLAFMVPINISLFIYLLDYFTNFEMSWATVSAFNLSILIFFICAIITSKNRTQINI